MVKSLSPLLFSKPYVRFSLVNISQATANKLFLELEA